MFLNRYEGAAQKTPHWITNIARWLVWMRQRSSRAKPVVDWIRAGIARYCFAPCLDHEAAKRGSGVERLSCLIDWLDSTGEFKQEVVRLENWRNFLATLNPEKSAWWLHTATELAHNFARKAEIALGSYTQRVAAFATRQKAHLCWREDVLMRCKPAVEYHLNVLAAEVMNRGLRDSFLATRQRIVLVPGCMRSRPAHQCKARVNGVDITCAGCDPACSVSRVTREMLARGVRVYIVPHSGGFSRWLARWEQTGVGVTAVACLLNIFPGGLEMRERGIASQCLALDFPGCRKHWDALGFPTAVNEPRLVQIAIASADQLSQR